MEPVGYVQGVWGGFEDEPTLTLDRNKLQTGNKDPCVLSEPELLSCWLRMCPSLHLAVKVSKIWHLQLHLKTVK